MCCRVENECKNDVYDFGVILLEIILGRPIMFQNEVGVLKDLVSVSYHINLFLLLKHSYSNFAFDVQLKQQFCFGFCAATS